MTKSAKTMLTEIIPDDLPLPKSLRIFRKSRPDGGSTVVIEVTTRAPNGTHTNRVKVSCDYGAVPYLAESLAVASEVVCDRLHLHGDE